MNGKKLSRIILSDIAYEKLVAEINLDQEPILLLDREDGRDSVKISFLVDGGWSNRIPIDEFIQFLIDSKNDLTL
jgi:transcriptional regulator of nitric oxide reductase